MKHSRKFLKRLFQLDPEVVFLNHGSFGACPRAVTKAYQDWQRRFERQPVRFMHELGGFFSQARDALGEYVQTPPGDLAFVINATHGVNVVTHSLPLQPGDQILTTNQEYGSCINAWNFACEQTGAELVRQSIALPVQHPEEVVERFWAGVTDRTRVVYFSHVTSPTAMILPAREICRRAREAGILSVIDGAHAPGQVPLNLPDIGADFYIGNCHKWMMSPKGAGFLYVRPEHQEKIRPLQVGHSYYPNRTGPGFPTHVESLGTRDPSAALSIPALVAFMKKYDWEEVSRDCKSLLTATLERITEITGLSTLYPLNSGLYSQMAVAPIDPAFTSADVQTRLLQPQHIEMPVFHWENYHVMRISVQGYTTQEDMDCLVEGVKNLYQGRLS